VLKNTTQKEITMKKFLNLMILLLVFAVTASVVHAYPTLQFGDNELYYTNREVVFRDYDDGNGYVELDYRDLTAPPQLEKGDIFIGTLKVQEIVGDSSSWFQAADDQLTGIFALEITNITENITGLPGDFSVILDLGVASATSFTTLENEAFSTGLSGTEVMTFYTHDSVAWEDDGSIKQDFEAQISSDEWMSLGIETGTDDYAFTYITPQGTGVDDFIGKSYLGLSVLDFYDPSMVFLDIVDPEVGLTVDFYANSELEGHDDFIEAYDLDTSTDGYSPWVFESNDPAYVDVVPEPGTLLLVGTGLLGFSALARRKRR